MPAAPWVPLVSKLSRKQDRVRQGSVLLFVLGCVCLLVVADDRLGIWAVVRPAVRAADLGFSAYS